MQNNLKRASSVFGAIAFMLTLSACPPAPECAIDDDCEGTEVCSDEGTCEADPRTPTCINGLITCSTEQVCDEADGACKTCTTGAGCSGETPICDTAANSGMGVCKTCTEEAGCGPSAPICDTAANSGAGACIVCNADVGCPGRTCDLAANEGAGACVNCLGDTDCADAASPFCSSAGTCVACRDTDSTATGQDEGCTAESPICDTTGATPACRIPTCAEDAAYCVGCVDNADCAANEVCGEPTPASQCEPSPSDEAAASTVIGEILALSPPGNGNPLVITPGPKTVSGALVSYLQPDNGTSDPAGFLVQAEAAGPALFVAIDPATVTPSIAVGDRISFDVVSTRFAGSFFEAASEIQNLTVLSSGHPVQSLDSASPAGLKRDVSETAVAGSDEGELIAVTGTVAGKFTPAGGSMVSARFTTVGNPNDFYVRIPASEAVGLAAGCTVTLTTGAMYSNFSQIFFTAYHPDDVASSNCPPPTVQFARANSTTEVEVIFSNDLDPSTVQPTDFVITDGVTPVVVSAATASGDAVTLTTASPLADGTSYTVTVSTLSDEGGIAIGSSDNTATFSGISATAFRLVINEVDYDQPGTDSAEFIEIYNAGPGPAPLATLQVTHANGGSSAAIIKSWPLNTAVDSTGAAVTELPAGGYLLMASTATLTSLAPAAAIRVAITSSSNSASNIIENGSPDALVLFDTASNEALDSISYEGDTGTATIGTASVSTQEGLASTFAVKDAVTGSIKRFPNGRDTDSNDADIVGSDYEPAMTPGAANP